MSNRSIVEFNHDFAHDIMRDQQGFIDALRFALGHSTEGNWKNLQRFGVTYTTTCHHSDERKVVTKWRGYEL
jgi:hypothetical protein